MVSRAVFSCAFGLEGNNCIWPLILVVQFPLSSTFWSSATTTKIIFFFLYAWGNLDSCTLNNCPMVNPAIPSKVISNLIGIGVLVGGFCGFEEGGGIRPSASFVATMFNKFCNSFNSVFILPFAFLPSSPLSWNIAPDTTFNCHSYKFWIIFPILSTWACTAFWASSLSFAVIGSLIFCFVCFWKSLFLTPLFIAANVTASKLSALSGSPAPIAIVAAMDEGIAELNEKFLTTVSLLKTLNLNTSLYWVWGAWFRSTILVIEGKSLSVTNPNLTPPAIVWFTPSITLAMNLPIL